MNKSFLTNVAAIKSAMNNKKLVVFAGSGVSFDSGIPVWNKLTSELSADIEIPESERDSLRIAQMYYNEREHKEYLEKIRKVLKHRKTIYNEIHNIIFDLKPEHILTTNYDDLFEQVIKKRALPYSVVSRDEHFPFALTTNLLVKIHGDLGDSDIVLKEDDYLDYSRNHPLIEGFLKSMFASKIILFVGYSFSDLNLKCIIQDVRNILGKNFQKAYLITTEDLHDSQKLYLKNKGIVPVSYNDAQYQKNDSTEGNYIVDYLSSNNAISKNYYKKHETLSDKGQRLYDFLSFLAHYNEFNERLSKLHPIESAYYSLERFAEVKTVFPDFIADLFPFNNRDENVYGSDFYTLIIENNNISNFFLNDVSIVGKTITLSGVERDSKRESELLNYFNKVNTYLRYSGIFYIKGKNDSYDSFGTRGITQKYFKLLQNESTPCDCLNCCYNRFEWDKVLNRAFEESVTETTDLSDDLILAYCNYKLGNYFKSYQLYEEAANKAWQTGKYISYFIAKVSIKNIRNLIHYDFAISAEVRNEIITKIDALNLDQLLSQLSEIDVDQYRLLKEIKDEHYLSRQNREIEKILHEIKKVYDIFKTNGGIIIGPNYPEQLQCELGKLYSFVTNNCIILDEFTNFQSVVQKSIEGLIISYATDSRYNEKLKSFRLFTLKSAILFSRPAELDSLLKKYMVNEIIVNESDMSSFSGEIVNFFSSSYKTSSQFKMVYADSRFKNQMGEDFFKDKFRRVFSNLCIVISRIKFNEDDSTKISKAILNFLRVEEMLSYAEIEWLSQLFIRNSGLFSTSTLKEIISVCLNDKYFLRYNFMNSLARAKYNDHPDLEISDENIVNRIIATVGTSNNMDSEVLISLYDLVSDKPKLIVSQALSNRLINKFDAELYYSAARKKIINYEEWFDQYLDYVSKSSHVRASPENDLIRKNVTLPFYNFLLFRDHFNFNLTKDQLAKFSDLNNYTLCLLKPEAFDISKFELEWLLIFDTPLLLSKYKSIAGKIAEMLKETIKTKYDDRYAKIYLQYFAELN